MLVGQVYMCGVSEGHKPFPGAKFAVSGTFKVLVVAHLHLLTVLETVVKDMGDNGACILGEQGQNCAQSFGLAGALYLVT
ncbi:uncharacterized [Tachysurus ichikawai]